MKILNKNQKIYKYEILNKTKKNYKYEILNNNQKIYKYKILNNNQIKKLKLTVQLKQIEVTIILVKKDK